MAWVGITSFLDNLTNFLALSLLKLNNQRPLTLIPL